MATYFVTGATGFIGRHLVERLLAREGEIHVLVRPGSEEKLEAVVERLGGAGRIHAVRGDLAEPYLGVAPEARDALRGNVDHFFHLAAIYDMTADETENALLNVGGTQYAIDLANDLQAGTFHHTSSIAVAGEYEGHFTEDMFDEGQKLPTAYHRTKYESEKLVRTRVQGAWRVYRPGIVVGDSRTGEMDKIDGPYYFFKVIQKARHALPEWFPLIGLEVGWTNLVPVDYVAAAMDHIAHAAGPRRPGVPPVTSRGQRAGDVLNTFARAGHAPQMAIRIDKRMTDMLPKGVLSFALKLPALKGIRTNVLADLGIPDSVIEHMALVPRFDARDTAPRARGHRHRDPAARELRGQAVGLLGAQPRPRPVQGPLVRGRRERQDGRHHRRVERHRQGGRAQGRRGGRHPAARRAHPGEARRREGRDRGRRRHRVRLPRRPVGLRLDRLGRRSGSSPTTRRSTSSSTTPGARSGARSRSPTTASTTTSGRSSSTTWARSG